MVDSFGLPDDDVATEALQATVQENSPELWNVISDLLTPLNQTLTDNEAALTGVYQPLKRKLGGAIRSNNGSLGDVTALLTSFLTEWVGLNNYVLSQAQAAYDMLQAVQTTQGPVGQQPILVVTGPTEGPGGLGVIPPGPLPLPSGKPQYPGPFGPLWHPLPAGFKPSPKPGPHDTRPVYTIWQEPNGDYGLRFGADSNPPGTVPVSYPPGPGSGEADSQLDQLRNLPPAPVAGPIIGTHPPAPAPPSPGAPVPPGAPAPGGPIMPGAPVSPAQPPSPTAPPAPPPVMEPPSPHPVSPGAPGSPTPPPSPVAPVSPPPGSPTGGGGAFPPGGTGAPTPAPAPCPPPQVVVVPVQPCPTTPPTSYPPWAGGVPPQRQPALQIFLTINPAGTQEEFNNWYTTYNAPPTAPVPVPIHGTGGQQLPPPGAVSIPITSPKTGKCTTLECETILIPVPGSIAWCDGLPELFRRFVELGKYLWEHFREFMECFRLDIGKVEAWIGSISGALQIAFGPIAGLVKALFDATPVQCVINEVRCLAGAAESVVHCMGGCNSVELYFIAQVKAWIGLLKKLRVGTDALAWATVDLEVGLKPIEATLDYLLNQVCPVEVPSPAEAIECYLRGTAPQRQVQCWLEMRGIRWEIIHPVIMARRDQLTPAEMIQYLRRNNASVEMQEESLRNLGWLSRGEAAARVALFDELPTIGDHLHWLQRNVFDDEYVKDYELTKGFEERFWKKFGHDLRARGMKKDYAALHYAAHWINPAPEQLKEMVYRLREGKPGVDHPFKEADYERLLAEMDVSPYFRPRFKDVLHPIPALSYLRDMYRQFLLTDAEMQSYHQDLGYTKEDSEHFVAIDRVMRARIRATQGHGWNPAAIAKGYISGALTALQVHDRMKELGYRPSEAQDLMDRANSDLRYTLFIRARQRAISSLTTQVRSAIRVGIMSGADAETALTAQGWPAPYARSIAASEIAGAQAARVTKAIGHIRSSYLSGMVNQSQAEHSLGLLGVISDAIRSYLQVWQGEFTPRRKRRTAAQIVRDVGSRMMTTDEAIARLKNLGYDDADTMLFMADAKAAIAKRDSAQKAAQDRLARASGKELDRLHQQTTRQRDQLVAALRRVSPPGRLQTWAAKDLVSQEVFFSRMALFGIGEGDIQRYWNEACSRKKALCQPHDFGTPGQGGGEPRGSGNGAAPT